MTKIFRGANDTERQYRRNRTRIYWSLVIFHLSFAIREFNLEVQQSLFEKDLIGSFESQRLPRSVVQAGRDFK